MILWPHKAFWIFLLCCLSGQLQAQAPESPPDPDVLIISSTTTIYENPTGGVLPGPPRSRSFFQKNSGAIIGGSVAGGLALFGAILFVMYKIRQSNRRWEDDEYLKTSANPFKSTLEQYHVGSS
ncbi:hypothetical protein DSO57_1013251 [Entomophthora muscae]|uniref:Uncharacterized protein n=2 Tax=Entomophthora muscae TaxID=34485 RepID=A0ACC2SDP3_9FUNG|nr:hypothetical protein DSO57_1030538 [Entomophthora muscae]KAJ9062195.1 hypothetical protein DSO57_1013251 [Entomophthora muscae]